MGNSHNNNLFLAADDSLGTLINKKANDLFNSLSNLDATALSAKDQYNDYFLQHHLGKRLFFSIQNSAHILYDSIKICNKPLQEINAVDYGAGLGTLFMLGGMIGCKRFDYNDHLPEWQQTAKAVCKAIGITINGYITGDIKAVATFAAANTIQYDIVLSRNVIEHIYDLAEFYTVIYKHNPKAVIYSTTTANYHNPAMRLYHIYIHKKAEKGFYFNQRMEAAKKLQAGLSSNVWRQVALQTRGKGQQDFIEAVNYSANKISIKKDSSLRSNTCDCITGVWSEHLLTKKEYRKIITAAGFTMRYTAGYWDTHYSSAVKNIIAKFFNKIISLLGTEKAVILSPFVNVTACN